MDACVHDQASTSNTGGACPRARPAQLFHAKGKREGHQDAKSWRRPTITRTRPTSHAEEESWTDQLCTLCSAGAPHKMMNAGTGVAARFPPGVQGFNATEDQSRSLSRALHPPSIARHNLNAKECSTRLSSSSSPPQQSLAPAGRAARGVADAPAERVNHGPPVAVAVLLLLLLLLVGLLPGRVELGPLGQPRCAHKAITTPVTRGTAGLAMPHAGPFRGPSGVLF